jgi:hypothetical protein
MLGSSSPSWTGSSELKGMAKNGVVFSVSTQTIKSLPGRPAALDSTIEEVRDRSPFGVACEQKPWLTLNSRSTFVVLSWHYPFKGAAPRLVTAYPTT